MVRSFSETGKNDVPVAGGKGANLGEMTRAGLSVPTGFVVTADAYREFIRTNGLDSFISEQLAEAGDDEEKLLEAAKRFRERMTAGTLPERVWDAVLAEYGKLGDNARVAVRSSATAEDLPDASFAGQQETYLNVRGGEELKARILDCYASLWGGRAVIYRQKQGYGQTGIALAVVVQEMVESETAGVLFTADPVTGNRDEMQINASYGLGESVVSGRVTADTYICDKSGNVKSFTLGTKATEIIYADSGTAEVRVSEERRAARALDDAQVKTLCAEAVKVEEYYGMPMDIEWAFRDGKAYILQARAITTLENTFDDALIEGYAKRNPLTGALKKNMAFLLEKISAPFYPLDSEFVAAINEQKSAIASEVGIIMSMQPMIDDKGITYLPSAKKRIGGKITHLPALIGELKDYKHCEECLKHYISGAEERIARLEQLDTSALSAADCADELEGIIKLVKKLCYGRFKYALFPAFFTNGGIARILKKVDKNLTSDDLYGGLSFKTAEVSRGIAKLAKAITDDPELRRDVEGGMTYESVCAKYPSMARMFAEFMDNNGYKLDFNCYCVYSSSFIEAPQRLMGIIRPLIGAENSEDDGAAKYEDIMRKIREVCGSEAKFEKVKTNIEYQRYFHVMREQSQYMWEEIFFHGRRILARTAELLCGDAGFRDGIAYLFFDELTEACRRGSLTDEDSARIAERRANRPLAQKVWERCKLEAFDISGDVLKGIGGSSGEATGPARVIHGPEEFCKMQKGDILVCPYTDPEWTPLFRLAAGVVADTGASLSHAAIVAREYGIPAVLGVGYATSKFADGDMIAVNGTKGEAAKIG